MTDKFKSVMKSGLQYVGRQARDKKKKKLGIEIPALVRKFMTSSASGFVEKTEYNYFWLSMHDDAPDVDVYIHLLVSHLLAFMSNNSQRIPFNAQVLLNTINFLVLRHPTQSPSADVKNVLLKWNKNRLKYSNHTLPAAKDVLGVLYKQRVEENDGLDSLIIQCYQFYSHDELSRIADYYENPTIIHVVDGHSNIGRSSGDKVCIWPYLKRLAARDPANLRLVMEYTITKLKSISGQILLLPKLAEISLLALLFMMRQLISSLRVPDEQWLDKSISNLKRFYLWPVPYGSQAAALLIALQRERVSPGHALLHKVWRECRLPEVILDPADLPQAPMSPGDIELDHDADGSEYAESTSFRPLYYLFDVDDQKALLFANVMKIDAQTDWGDRYQVHSGPSALMAALLMLHILKFECGAEEAVESALQRLTADQIKAHYLSVVDIFLCAENKEARREQLLAAGRAIVQMAASCDGVDEEQQVLLDCDLEQLRATEYAVGMPPLHHTGIGCDLKRREWPSSGQMAANEMMYPSNEVLAKLTTLLKQLDPLTHDTDADGGGGAGAPITLRFMVAGGNSILSGVATAYASLIRHAQTLLCHFEIEFFILPYSRNHYADWLARQDPWYNRHIYLPLECQLFVAPSLLPDTKSKLRSHGHLHTVGQFYREMSEQYAREADQLVKLRLWECLCWESPPYTKTPHQLIPFCQRVELGNVVDRRGQEEMYQLGPNRKNTVQNGQFMDDMELIDEDTAYLGSVSDLRNGASGDTAEFNGDAKYDAEDDLDFDAFDYNPVALDVEWQGVDMLGRAQMQPIQQKSQYLDALSLSSVPRYGDKGVPASPDKAGEIHLFCKVRDSNKKKKYQEYALLKTEPSQHVRTCVISSNSHSDKFFICVDDQIYGKFSRIKVQPMMDPVSKDQVFMPIRTFFPVNV